MSDVREKIVRAFSNMRAQERERCAKAVCAMCSDPFWPPAKEEDDGAWRHPQPSGYIGPRMMCAASAIHNLGAA